MKSARKYRPLARGEVGQFKQETKEDELKVVRRGRVDILKTRQRIM